MMHSNNRRIQTEKSPERESAVVGSACAWRGPFRVGSRCDVAALFDVNRSESATRGEHRGLGGEAHRGCDRDASLIIIVVDIDVRRSALIQ